MGDLGSIPGIGRERLPTPVFWPGEFHGLYRPWGHKELDTTEQLSLSGWKPRLGEFRETRECSEKSLSNIFKMKILGPHTAILS